MTTKKLPPFIGNTSPHRALPIELVVTLALNVLILLLFFYLSRYALARERYMYDQAIASFVYTLRAPGLTKVMLGITLVGSTKAEIILTLLLVLLIAKKHKKASIVFSLSLIGAGILNYILKIVFMLPRPNIAPLEILSDFTYPSGHAMNTLVFYGLLTYYVFRFSHQKLFGVGFGIVAAIWIVLVGFSRVYLGVHYPSDVLAGYLTGAWWLLSLLLIDRTLGLKRQLKK